MISAYWITALACLLLVFLLYKEWKRPLQRRLAARWLATALLVTSLLLLAWPAEQQLTGSTQNVLLTPGFSEDSVANWMRQHGDNVKMFTTDASLLYKNAPLPLLLDFTTFSRMHPHDTLQVFGNGLPASTWKKLAPVPIAFHPPADKRAITDIFWQQQLELGATLLVQGNYDNNGNTAVTIQLDAFGAVKDSVTIAAGRQQPFQLRTVPLHSGNAVYTLRAISGTDTLCAEPLPVAVAAPAPLRLLIISAAPDFENTYLKNHLAGKGFLITMITTVSSNKTDRQYLNTALQQNDPPITADYLSGFDVLLSDPETLKKMNTAALNNVRAAVQNKGLGLLIRMDSTADASSFYTRHFPLQHLPTAAGILALHSTTADSTRIAIKTANRTAIRYRPGVKPLLQDEPGNCYAAAALYGNGFVVATTLQQTYSLALSGNQPAYQQLWATLLRAAAKPVYTEEQWRTEPFFTFQHAPASVVLEKNELAVPLARADSVTLYLQQDEQLPFIWKAVYWPVEAGWQMLPAAQQGGNAWYVYPKNSWQQLINYQHRLASTQYAAVYANVPATTKEARSGWWQHRQFWLLLLFMACCTFLWIEQKLS
ncbi:MAG TPA: hypothetical protein VL307_03515 [Chitinophagaceae bacterium]|nr:hypothetical protein [Chitinophagaceae bacterium]